MLSKTKKNNIKFYTAVFIATISYLSPLLGMEEFSIPYFNPKSLDKKFDDADKILEILRQKNIEYFHNIKTKTIKERLQVALQEKTTLRFQLTQLVQFLHAQHQTMLEFSCYCDLIRQFVVIYDKREDHGLKICSYLDRPISSHLDRSTLENLSFMLYLMKAKKDKIPHQKVIKTITPFLKSDIVSLRKTAEGIFQTLIQDMRDATEAIFIPHLCKIAKIAVPLSSIINNGYTYPLLAIYEERMRYNSALDEEEARGTFTDTVLTKRDRAHHAEMYAISSWYHEKMAYFNILYKKAFEMLSDTSITGLLDTKQLLTSISLDQMVVTPAQPETMDFALSGTDILEELAGLFTLISDDVESAPKVPRKKLAEKQDRHQKKKAHPKGKPHHKKFNAPCASASADTPTDEELCDKALQTEDSLTILDSEVTCTSSVSAEPQSPCRASSSSSGSASDERKPRKEVKSRLFDTKKWQYDARVITWHTNPHEALAMQNYLTEKSDDAYLEEMIIRHRVPFELEEHFQHLAIITNKTNTNKKTGMEEKNITLNFLGAIERPDQETLYGIFSITINPANHHVFHRFFSTNPTQKFATKLQHCREKVSCDSDTGDSFTLQTDLDLDDSACRIEENDLTVRITDRYGIVYILFKGHLIE